MTETGTLRFSKEHEWIRVEGEGRAVIGITDYAQKELGDIVFVELPSPGDSFEKGDGMAVVESVKAVSDVYAPFSGRVLEVNAALEDSPELVNRDPYGEGWLVVMELGEPGELENLLTGEEYARLYPTDAGRKSDG
ncbi:MAG: glycine cleavage system protein GcvH [Firmicutes bacterium]|nr:glycine cleavage system protein GcvH [Bacillota bacterium]